MADGQQGHQRDRPGAEALEEADWRRQTPRGSRRLPRRLPPYPEPLFPDGPDKRRIQKSEVDDLLVEHAAWIKERLTAGRHAITVFEELPVKVQRSSFYRFLDRHGIGAKDRKTRRVVPEIVHAIQKRSVPLDWLENLLAREWDERRERATLKRIQYADFPEITAIEAFDWGFNPDIDEARIRRLAELDFLAERRIALFLGKPGTGKTHLALAIGVRAAKAGHRV